MSAKIVLSAGIGTEGLEARTRKRHRLLDELRRHGPMSTAEAARVVDETDVALVRDLLNDLVRAGLAISEGRTKGRRYRHG